MITPPFRGSLIAMTSRGKLDILMITACLLVAAFGMSYVVLPGLTMVDYVEAWPATDRFANGIRERLDVYPAALRGRAEARLDVDAGRITLKLFGSPPPWRVFYSDILRSRGIESKVVAGCTFTTRTEPMGWMAYNEVMLDEIERRHGKSFMQSAATQAEIEYRRRRFESTQPAAP